MSKKEQRRQIQCRNIAIANLPTELFWNTYLKLEILMLMLFSAVKDKISEVNSY